MIDCLEARTFFALTLAGGFTSSLDTPGWLTVAGEQAFFVGKTSATGQELWRTDGTPQGTYIVQNLALQSPSSTFGDMTPLGSRAVFVIREASSRQIWITDGTSQGTTLLKSLPVDPKNHEEIDQLTWFGKYVYMRVGGGHARSLWRTDGTVEGTRKTLKEEIVDGFSVESVFTSGEKLFVPCSQWKRGDQVDLALWSTDTRTTRAVPLESESNETFLPLGTDQRFFYFKDVGSFRKTDGEKTVTIVSNGVGSDASVLDDDSWLVYATARVRDEQLYFGSHREVVATQGYFEFLQESPQVELAGEKIYAVTTDYHGENPRLVALDANTAVFNQVFAGGTAIAHLTASNDGLWFYTLENAGTWYRTDGTTTTKVYERCGAGSRPRLFNGNIRFCQYADQKYSLKIATNGNGSISGKVFADPENMGSDTGVYLGGYRVFLDLNRNARLDRNEPVTRSTSKGTYRFDGLLPGTYNVRVTPASTEDLWTTPEGNSVTLTVAASGTKMVRTHPFGVGGPGARGDIRGIVFADRNGDGIRQETEKLLRNIPVSLSSQEQTLTASDGSFVFSGVSTVRVSEVRASLTDYASAGENLRVTPGGVANVILGLTPLHRLSVRVFNDLNTDGKKSTNEPFLPGIQVDIAESGDILSSQRLVKTLDAQGAVDIRLVVFDKRRVAVSASGWRSTTVSVSVQAIPDGHSTASFGLTKQSILSVSVQRDLTLYSGGSVYLDLDDNGTRDTGEPMKTLTNGHCEFANLPARDYAVRYISDDAILKPVGGDRRSVSVTEGAVSGAFFNLQRVDGTVRAKVLTDFHGLRTPLAKQQVWLDLDEDGARDSTEPTAQTDATGIAIFSGLLPGTYLVRLAPNPVWTGTLSGRSTISESGSATKTFILVPV